MDWNRFLDKNISQYENYDDVIDDDSNEALVTNAFVWIIKMLTICHN